MLSVDVDYLQLLQLASPEAVLALTALVVLTVGLARGRTASSTTTTGIPTPDTLSLWGHARDRSRTSALPFAITALGLVLAASAVLMLPRHAMLFHGMLVVSPLNSFFKIVCLILALFAMLLSHSTRALPHRGEYLALLVFATFGLFLLVGSEELLTIFIGLELLGLTLYVLTAFDKTNLRSAEAGLKYFLFGSTASAFTLFGISLVYGITGSTSLATIAGNVTSSHIPHLLGLGIIMTLIGFAFKIAVAPFHLWAPDAYQAGPIPSAAFIASGSKVASFVVLGKIVLIGFAPFHGAADWHALIAGWSPVLAALAALSILLGNLVALVQTNVPRLLAYSAVAHAGYTLLGIIAGGRDGFSATLFYTTIYAVTLVGAFGVCQVVRSERGGDDLEQFAGLRRRSPLVAACMAVFMLSLAGLPPLAGFFGKFYLFSAAFQSGGQHGLLWLVALALLGSLISLYYYLIVLKVIFVDETPTTGPAVNPQLLNTATVTLLAVLILVIGIAPETLVAHINASLR